MLLMDEGFEHLAVGGLVGGGDNGLDQANGASNWEGGN